MKNDTSILPFRQSETIADPLTELAREGARRMLAEALKASSKRQPHHKVLDHLKLLYWFSPIQMLGIPRFFRGMGITLSMSV
jgi:hypothetical protein